MGGCAESPRPLNLIRPAHARMHALPHTHTHSYTQYCNLSLPLQGDNCGFLLRARHEAVSRRSMLKLHIPDRIPWQSARNCKRTGLVAQGFTPKAPMGPTVMHYCALGPHRVPVRPLGHLSSPWAPWSLGPWGLGSRGLGLCWGVRPLSSALGT